MMMPSSFLAAITCAAMLFFLATAGSAAEEAEKALPDKSGYHLFHPTPKNFMRELEPDRPDKTERPYTVDAGHFQVEMSFMQYTLDDSEGIRTETWNVAPANFKAGLTNNTELQVILDNYLHIRTEDRAAGTTVQQSGFGDVTVRLKLNLWGNDGGLSA